LTFPSISKRDPWQGQSKVRASPFQPTVQPRCVHFSENAENCSPSPRTIITGFFAPAGRTGSTPPAVCSSG
jgi:hypothetical protein